MVHQRLRSSAERNGADEAATSTQSASRRYACRCGVSGVRWPTWPAILLMFYIVSVETLSMATATRMHYIHWNTTNPM